MAIKDIDDAKQQERERAKKRLAKRLETLGAISVDATYPLEVFKPLSGLNDWALRQARRAGLRVLTLGRCRFVRGCDFHEFLANVEK
jgi:hypothetical protein